MQYKQNFSNLNYNLLKKTIREYDIKEAGFNLIKYYNLLSAEDINELSNMTKEERTIEIGKLQGYNKDFSKSLMDSFLKIQDEFIKSNNLIDDDILSIRKDAIFVIGKVCNNVNFGEYVYFANKSSYTSFYRIDKYEFYYNIKNNLLDIKGLNDLSHPLIGDLKSIIRLYELRDKDYIFKKLQNLRYEYLNYDLDSEYYREISTGMFRISRDYNKISNQDLLIEEVDEETFDIIDISYNYLNLIYPFISLLI
jgi:hypothetical protein